MSSKSPNSSFFRDRSTPASVEGDSSASGAMMPLLTKLSAPYLTQHQIDHLRSLTELKGSTLKSMLSTAFNHIWNISHVYKFPMKTIGTATILFQKTYLYNNLSNFHPLETTIACLMVSSKIEDTPKKARELVQTSYYLKSQSVSSSQIEETRTQVLSLERQILETIGFDFRIRHPHPYVIKLSKELGCSRGIALIAWSISTDAYLTDAILKFPSHIIALSSVILATKVTGKEESLTSSIDYNRFHCKETNVKNVLLDLVDSYSQSYSSSRLAAILQETGETTTIQIDHPTNDFMTLRININNELHSQPPTGPHGSVEGFSIRDPKLSDKGTVRYILYSEREEDDRNEEAAS